MTHRTTRFTLERHAGPYETWPLRSRLFADGAPTRLSLPGYALLHAYEGPDAFLFVTDYDCPFEEMTCFTLASKDLRVLSRRHVGRPYSSFLLTALEWTDERGFVATFSGGYRLRFTIRPWGVPLLFPRLKVQRLRDAAESPLATPA